MAETLELNATVREDVGKANRHLAGTGRLAAVLYGPGQDPQAISVDRHEFEQLARHEGLTSSLLKLSVGDGKAVNVIVKAIQRDPIKGTITHADFWAVKMTQKITTLVPVHFLGDAPGVRTGGVMTHNLQQVRVEALPAGLPDYIEADTSTLEVGDSVHVKDLVAPDGVTILDPEDEIVCSVMAPKALEVEEVAEETGEPEVIGETAADEE
jgi:large subunit ribosomal protein L25